MSLKPYGVELQLHELQWLTRAVSDGFATRPELKYISLRNIEGCLYMAATDTHRLHVVRLGTWSNKEVDALLSPVRLAFEMNWRSVDSMTIAEDGCSIGTSKLPLECFAPYEAPKRWFPDWVKVIPKQVKKTFPSLPLNAKYLSDVYSASLLDNGRIIVRGSDDSNKPILITPTLTKPLDCKWFAALMPMRWKP